MPFDVQLVAALLVFGLIALALCDLSLPVDTLVLSIFRDRASLICHGYTRLELGDRVTIVGSSASLEEVRLKFAA